MLRDGVDVPPAASDAAALVQRGRASGALHVVRGVGRESGSGDRRQAEAGDLALRRCTAGEKERLELVPLGGQMRATGFDHAGGGRDCDLDVWSFAQRSFVRGCRGVSGDLDQEVDGVTGDAEGNEREARSEHAQQGQPRHHVVVG